MIVLSRYTRVGAYAEAAQRLKASCERWGLRRHIEEADDPGDWHSACEAKGKWILDCLLNWREAVLWLDADCEIAQLPGRLLGTHHDFAVYNYAADAGNGCGIAYDPLKLVSAAGVMLVGYTAAAIELMLRWIATIAQRPDLRGGDLALNEAYNTCRPPVMPLWLPQAYNRMGALWPDVMPVIDHHWTGGGLRDG